MTICTSLYSSLLSQCGSVTLLSLPCLRTQIPGPSPQSGLPLAADSFSTGRQHLGTVIKCHRYLYMDSVGPEHAGACPMRCNESRVRMLLPSPLPAAAERSPDPHLPDLALWQNPHPQGTVILAELPFSTTSLPAQFSSAGSFHS